jgi:uncharacterized protein GlcG (DUF336 family)
MSITQAQAEIAIAAAVREAVAIGVPMNVAVYDDGANLKAFKRMDGALLGSADIAMNRRAPPRSSASTPRISTSSRSQAAARGFDQTNGGLIVFRWRHPHS